jgi:cysteine desulfurase
LETLGFGPDWARGGLRLTLGHSTTEDDINTVLEVLPPAVESIRRITASVLAAG